MQLVQTTPHYTPKQPIRYNSFRNHKLPVEIIGISTSNGFQSLVGDDEQQNSSTNKLESSSKINFDFSPESSVTSRTKNQTKSGENLTEKNYLQIIENLTSRYGMDANPNTRKTTKKVNSTELTNTSTNNNEHSLDYLSELGLNFEKKATIKQNSIGPSFKSLEKKYKGLISVENAQLSRNGSNRELQLSSLLNTNQINNPNNTNINSSSTSNSSSSQSYVHRSLSPRIFAQQRAPSASSIRVITQQVLATSKQTSTTPNRTINKSPLIRQPGPSPQQQQRAKSGKSEHTAYLQMVKPISPALRVHSQPSGLIQKKNYQNDFLINNNTPINRNSPVFSTAQ